VHFDAGRLEALPKLVALFRVAVDIRNIDVAAASERGILVCHASRSWVPAVAELVFGLMIDIARGISRANLAYKAGREPDVRMGRQLAGSTIGIIGYGPLARRVADLACAFGMDVLVYDPYVRIDDPRHSAVALGELLARADYVVPLAVATKETENLIDAGRLRQMKRSAFLVNLSRGNLVDEAALRAALDRGEIAGAALDVGRAHDQMPEAETARRADVTATPHIGGLTQEAIEGQALEAVQQVETLLSGRVPHNAVNGVSARRAIKRFSLIM
jgi:D-3-phosphoglycerate dehydrogenase